MRSTVRQRILVLGLLLMGSLYVVTPFAEEAPRRLTPEIVADLQMVQQVALAPNGEYAVFVLRTPRGPDEEPGGPYTELFRVDLRPEASPRQYTYRPHDVRQVEWSPDGQTIAILSRRKEQHEKPQIYLIPVDGGEARRLTDAETGVIAFHWSPDGSRIAYIAVQPETEEEKTAKKKGRDWIEVDKKFHHRRLYIVDVASGTTRELDIGERSVWDFTWSPDGSTILFQASPTPKTDDSYVFKKMYRIPADGSGAPELVVETEGKLGHVAWSPDGRRIAWNGAVDIHDPAAGSLFVCTVDACTPRNLTGDAEETVQWVTWWNDDELLVLSTEGEHTVLKIVPATGGRARVIIGPQAGYRISQVSVWPNGRVAALRVDTYRHPPELYGVDLRNGHSWRVTHHNPVLDGMTFQRWEVYTWKARDGWTIRGILLKPLAYDPNRRYPLVVQIHGGPEAAYTVGWQTYYSRWSHLLSHHGYMVLAPNYRGSTGRGVRFAKADHADLGGKEFLDVIDGVNALAAEGKIDRNRVGIGGGSYGGYFSALAATRYAGEFRAAINFAGISNQLSKPGTSDIPWEMTLVHYNLPPTQPDRPAGFYFEAAHRLRVLAWSPIWYIERAVARPTAILIVHGMEDRRVPVTQAWELYRALKMAGHPHVEMVLYPREGHGLRERNHQVDFLHRVLDWYGRFVKGAE